MIKPNTHTNLSIDHSLPTTKSEWVAHELRKAIFAGELKPGDTLLQDTLAEQFGVSSTPVREAFRQLVAEGLVLLRPHKSAEIVQPAYTASQIKELYLIRKVLEGLAIEIAVPNLTDDDLKDLQRYNNEMIESLAQGDIDSARGANRKFHYVFYRAADSPFLLKLLGMLWARVPWDTALLAEGRSEHSLVEHQAIIEATLSGDSKAAGRAMRNHIEKGGEVIIRSFDETK